MFRVSMTRYLIMWSWLHLLKWIPRQGLFIMVEKQKYYPATKSLRKSKEVAL